MTTIKRIFTIASAGLATSVGMAALVDSSFFLTPAFMAVSSASALGASAIFDGMLSYLDVKERDHITHGAQYSIAMIASLAGAFTV